MQKIIQKVVHILKISPILLVKIAKSRNYTEKDSLIVFS